MEKHKLSQISIWGNRKRSLHSEYSDRIVNKIASKTNSRCAYCGKNLNIGCWQIDHIFPKSLGGSSEIDNLVITCSKCNASKGSMSLDEYRYKIASQKFIEYSFNQEQIDYLCDRGINIELPEFLFFFEVES